jgi:hypothetical protein
LIVKKEEIMAKFNEKREPRVPTETNLMGEKAWKLTPKEELVSTVLTTFIQKSYYESENEVLNRIKKALEEVDPLFAAKLAIYTRTEANMRSSSHVLAGELARRLSGKEWATRFYEKIVVRPDDMSEILGYYQLINKGGKVKLPNSMKKGFKKRLERLDAYLIDKYKMKGRDISLVDLVNLFHPKPTQKNAKAFDLLVNEGGKGLDQLYSTKILEKTMSAAGQTKGDKNEAKKEAITSVLENAAGMPIFNLLRNLRNIILYAPDKVDDAIRQLTIPEKIQKSRLLPFRFLSAYNEIYAMTSAGATDKIVFEDEKEGSLVNGPTMQRSKAKVLGALEQAIELSCANIPVLEGRTAVLIDHSGSVRGDGGGASLVSAFSKTRTVDIGNLFAAMLIKYQPNVYVGLFGDRLIPFNIDRNKGILAMAKQIHEEGRKCGPGTEAGIYDFFKETLKSGKGVDNVIIFSDMVIGDGCRWYGHTPGTNPGDFRSLFKSWRKTYGATKVISVDIRQTGGTSVFDKSYNVTQVAGWSEKIFNIIEAGTVGYKAIIAEIEKIEI